MVFWATVVMSHFALWAYVMLHEFDKWWEYHVAIEGFVLLPLFTSVAWGFYVWLLARPDPTR